MIDTNHAHARDHEHWDDLLHYAPVIPDAPTPNPADVNWTELGEYAWHYSVATGHFGDDKPELHTARAHRANIQAHLPHLDADQLRAYIGGLMAAIDGFMWPGL
jgi:hypothetical protein